MDLQKILSDHAAWLADLSTGARANLQNADLQYADLRNADLRGANLQYANLRGANLQYANLRGANLQNADLQYADLRNADLRGANLQYANLRGALGVVYLTQTDAGYAVLAQQSESEAPWRIRAGCRDFSIEEAIVHWSDPDYHTPSSGRRVVACIEWFKKENGL